MHIFRQERADPWSCESIEKLKVIGYQWPAQGSLLQDALHQ